MNTTQQHRWEVAKEEAERVNDMIALGYLAINDGDILTVPFTITDKGIYEVHNMPEGGSCTNVWFENDPEYDHGIYDPVKKIRQLFRSIKFYKNVPVRAKKKKVAV